MLTHARLDSPHPALVRMTIMMDTGSGGIDMASSNRVIGSSVSPVSGRAVAGAITRAVSRVAITAITIAIGRIAVTVR